MPSVVGKVPDPWEPYKDGQLWKFSQDEIRTMPNFQPMVNKVDNSIAGLRMIQWYESGHYYVRFVREEDCMDLDWLDRAAGWAD